MTTVIKDDEGNNLLLVKGDTLSLLKNCENLLNLKTGKITQLSEKEREEISAVIDTFQSDEMMNLGFAYTYPEQFEENDIDENGLLSCEGKGLIFIGFCGIKSIVRRNATEAIKQCNNLGVEVKIFSECDYNNAKYIASECGVIQNVSPHHHSKLEIIHADDFFQFVGGLEAKVDHKGELQYKIGELEQFSTIYEHVKVVYRSQPQDKLAMITGLKEQGHVVAFIGTCEGKLPSFCNFHGDDALSQISDCSDGAKKDSNLIELDSDLRSVVAEIKRGRYINISCRKAIKFQLTVITSIVILTLISTIFTTHAVFSPFQILWVSCLKMYFLIL